MADASLLPLLIERSYHPIELTSVMYRELGSKNEREDANRKVTARLIGTDEIDLWAKTSAAAWTTENESLGEFMLNFGQVSARCSGAFPYLAKLDGEAIATGMLLIYEDTCILAGASTIPEARNQGAQNALLRARLNFALDKGCTLAIMGAATGSQSQRNAQKKGFNIAYTRIKWQLK